MIDKTMHGRDKAEIMMISPGSRSATFILA
jgi:hypothetical protein